MNENLVRVNCKINLVDEHYSILVPGSFVANSGCVPFDHRTKSISELVQSSLPNSTFDRWQRCCDDAVECCTLMVTNFQAENFFNTCDNHWDGNSCFLDTFPGENTNKMCPYEVTKDDNSNCHSK